TPLVPTLRVGTRVGTLRVPSQARSRASRTARDAERPRVPTRSVGTRDECMSPSLQPLGDQAALATFADEAAALRWAAAVRALAPAWLVDVVQAYTTVAVYFDLDATTFAAVAAALPALDAAGAPAGTPGTLHHIPCCYELGPDLGRVAEHTR